ncbi:hypothetical protein BDFB_008793 [Asbolus verrucosus]|uniref:Uncharacterized protein n=1 Tax=Asbolus verrucosus TaxID=1661398 RepID=A0A482VD11_ASBVE|nr:hypothetical protein BDFB_008793 [Asbolus verrucosus]
MVKVVFCASENYLLIRWTAVVSRSAFQQPTASYFFSATLSENCLVPI